MRPSLLKSQPSPDLTFSWQCALHSSTARNLKTPDPLRGAPSECALQAITWTTVQPVVFNRSYGKDARNWCWTIGVMGNQASCKTLRHSAQTYGWVIVEPGRPFRVKIRKGRLVTQVLYNLVNHQMYCDSHTCHKNWLLCVESSPSAVEEDVVHAGDEVAGQEHSSRSSHHHNLRKGIQCDLSTSSIWACAAGMMALVEQRKACYQAECSTESLARLGGFVQGTPHANDKDDASNCKLSCSRPCKVGVTEEGGQGSHIIHRV